MRFPRLCIPRSAVKNGQPIFHTRQKVDKDDINQQKKDQIATLEMNNYLFLKFAFCSRF